MSLWVRKITPYPERKTQILKTYPILNAGFEGVRGWLEQSDC